MRRNESLGKFIASSNCVHSHAALQSTYGDKSTSFNMQHRSEVRMNIKVNQVSITSVKIDWDFEENP